MTKITSLPHKTRICLILLFITFLTGINGCKKQELFNAPPVGSTQDIIGKDVISTIDSLQQISFFIKNRPNPDAPVKGVTATNTNIQLLNTGNEMEYTDETYMVLGLQLNNPYSIPNMTAAYNAFFNLQLGAVSVTHKYVRFSPTNESQIAMLDDSLELDLYTHPLDYEMLQDGDLYVNPGSSIEDLPFLYTVVPSNYNLPGNITHTVLADLHLPEGEAALYIEELAESMALGANYSSTSFFQNGSNITTIIREDVTSINGENPTYSHNFSNCLSPDYQSLCPGEDNPTPPPPPPVLVCGLPALGCIQSGYPRGRIRVLDTQLGICEPVADVKIRTKNWFKIRNTRTDVAGNFYINKRYANRVKINVIFRNDEVSVRPMRNKLGIRLSLFPITYTLGVFTTACSMNTVDKVFERTNDKLSKGFEAWLACNAINSRKEQIAFAENPAEGLKALKDFRLNIYLQKYGAEYFSGPQAELLMQNYLWRNREPIDWIIETGKLALYYFSNDAVGLIVTLLNNVLGTQKPDIVYSYNTHPDNPSLSLQNLSSNEVKQKFYDVYTQAGILKATDNNVKWKNYFKLRTKMIDAGAGALGTTVKNAFKEYHIKLFKLPGASDVGPTMANWSSIVSLTTTLLQQVIYSVNQPDRQYFEMVNGFSEYYAHRMCATRYGASSDAIYNQKRLIVNSAGGQSSHAILLENWQPNLPIDLKQFERLGLYNDLQDSNIDEVQPFNLPIRWRDDLVQNVTSKAMFYSITGSGGNLQWFSPETYLHFADNVKSQYPAQLTNLNNSFIAYLIQNP